METAADIPLPDPESFERLAGLVHRLTGIRLGHGKAYFLAGRLGRLYRVLGCRDWTELCARLEAGAAPSLTEELIQAAVVGETQFFRDALPFRALREKILPEAVAGGAAPAAFRVWSAACSTGQEPYSIAMSLWDWADTGRIDLHILATDICTASLAQARRAEFGSLELARGLTGEARSRFFEDLPGGRGRVRQEVRRKVRFQRLNLLTEELPESGFHVVFCRNVAIYFDAEGKRRLYDRVARALLPGGYLLLGAAEPVLGGIPGLRTLRWEGLFLYRKNEEGSG